LARNGRTGWSGGQSPRITHKSRYCSFAYSALACFRRGISGVGIFPEGEEVFVGGERPCAQIAYRFVALQVKVFPHRDNEVGVFASVLEVKKAIPV